jgi:hypothetical protein
MRTTRGVDPLTRHVVLAERPGAVARRKPVTGTLVREIDTLPLPRST